MDHWSPCDCDIIRWRLAGASRGEEVDALREFAIALAPWAAWYAAKRASDAQLEMLSAYADRMRADAEARRFASFAELEISFQSLLFRATGNRVWEGVASLMGDAIRMTYCDAPEKILHDKSMGEPYHALAAAIRERDAARARDIMIEILHHLGFEACAGFVPNGAPREADA